MNHNNEIKNIIIDNKIYKKIKDYSKEKNTIITYFEIGNNNTIGILICKKENKIKIKYCSNDRISVREYELV